MNADLNAQRTPKRMTGIVSKVKSFVLLFLWPPYGIGQAIIFLSCGFFLSSIFFFLDPNSPFTR